VLKALSNGRYSSEEWIDKQNESRTGMKSKQVEARAHAKGEAKNKAVNDARRAAE
jgi:hypothetical protein